MDFKVKVYGEYLSQFKVGEKIPCIISSAAITGLSRNSVRECVAHFKSVGVLSVKHGKAIRLIKDPLELEEHF